MTAPTIPRPVDVADDRERVAQLVAAAKAGDAEAFGQLYDRYVDAVYRFALRKTGDRHLAEDITADTFVRALRKISEFEVRAGGFIGWLHTIARNLAADHFRSARYRTRSLFGVTAAVDQSNEIFAANDFLPNTNLHYIEPATAHDQDPATAAEAYQRSRALLTALDCLTGEQREVMLNRFWQDLTLAETAQVMGKNIGQVKSLQYRATRELGRQLRAAGYVLGETL